MFDFLLRVDQRQAPSTGAANYGTAQGSKETEMKRLMVGVVVALIMAGVGRAMASVVYDNGPINGTINSWAISPVDLSYDPDTLDIVPSVDPTRSL